MLAAAIVVIKTIPFLISINFMKWKLKCHANSRHTNIAKFVAFTSLLFLKRGIFHVYSSCFFLLFIYLREDIVLVLLPARPDFSFILHCQWQHIVIIIITIIQYYSVLFNQNRKMRCAFPAHARNHHGKCFSHKK